VRLGITFCDVYPLAAAVPFVRWFCQECNTDTLTGLYLLACSLILPHSHHMDAA
jgi:hypothetical protein